MRIFITGATGFVGINTVFELSKKHELFLLVRNIDKARFFEGLGNVRLISGDVVDFKADISENFDAIIHIAGRIKADNLQKLYQTNVDGCKNIALFAKQKGIRNIVYLSSLAARGPDERGYPVSNYGNSKRLGELEFLKLHFDSNLKILRPPIIYGPYDRGMLDVFRISKTGFFPVLERVYSLVHVFDVVKAIEKLLYVNRQSAKIYYISGGDLTMEQLAKKLFEAFLKKGRIIKMPEIVIPLLRVLSHEGSPLTKDKLRELKATKWLCDNTELYRDTNFLPEIDHDDGLRKTALWYEEHGWL